MTRFLMFCSFLVLVFANFIGVNAGTRIVRSPQRGPGGIGSGGYGSFGPSSFEPPSPPGPPGPPPPPGLSTGNGPPGRFGPGFAPPHHHDYHGHQDRDSEYSIPPGGSISISKTISISSNGNAQSSSSGGASSGV